MTSGYLWCRHCGRPHPFGLKQCPTTKKVLETRIHRVAPPNAGVFDVGVIEGKYRIRSLLGEGASGRVFLAEDLSNGSETVAVKIHKSESGRRGKRFEQEGKLARSVRHPNVCRVLGHGRLPDGRPYIVMEALLEGQTLQRLLMREGSLDEALAVSIVMQLLSGLSAVHEVGIVHRDLKPSNVYLVKTSALYPTAKILDFGLAKAPPGKAIVVTRPGYTFGTPGYIAPELLEGEPPTSRSDIWAVGVMLFQMLSGRRPLRVERDPRGGRPVVNHELRSLVECAPHVSAPLATIVEAALASDPSARFPDVGTFRRELASYATESRRRKVCHDPVHDRPRLSVLPIIDYFSSSSPTGSSHDDDTRTTRLTERDDARRDGDPDA